MSKRKLENKNESDANQIARLTKELKRTAEELGRKNDLILKDPRICFWGTKMRGSESNKSGSNPTKSNNASDPTVLDKKTIKRDLTNQYGEWSCLFCGEKQNVTLAHIVSSNSNVDYSLFNKPTYKCDLNTQNQRNFFPLCGNDGEADTCHNEFDKYGMTLLYDPFLKSYSIYCFDDTFTKYGELHNKVINVKHKPYIRLLAWRTRTCLKNNMDKTNPENLVNLITSSNLSEDSHKNSNYYD